MKPYFFLLISIFLISSCQSSKPLFSYLPNPIQNDSLASVMLIPKEPKLRAGDKITLSIWGHDDLSIGSVNSVYASNEQTGKWLILDKEGEVNLPKIGRINLAGYTVKEANYFLEKQYENILNNPIINIRVLNHFVTVLGEVNKPGRYSLNNELLSLVDILAEARGLTAYSKSDEIELVRVIDGAAAKLRINLMDLASIPAKNIVLQPNDIIYVGATKHKNQDKALGKASLITGIVTGLAVVISVFK